MRIGHILLLAVMAWAVGCAGRRVAVVERPLFPGQDQTQWWVMNTVAVHPHLGDIHLCALLTLDPRAGKNIAACYVAAWSEADAAYRYGMRITQGAELSFKPRFPMHIVLPGDSTQPDWMLHLERNQLWLNAGTTTLKAKFPSQRPFPLLSMNRNREIWEAKPIEARFKAPKSTTGLLRMMVYIDEEKLLESPQGIALFTATLDNGRQVSALWELRTNGDAQLFGHKVWNPVGAEADHSINVRQAQTGTWTSPHTAKPYPLEYELQIDQTTYHLRPRMQDQEVRAKKGSLWMGAVMLADPATGMQAGKGNLYIFKP